MLYNDYRPSDYSEVCGQEDSLITLKRQSEKGVFGQAYLLAGHHGTGKTTIGRILSRAVNCLHPTENGPCNQCANCLASKKSLDIFELDAASNNGVDKIKELVSKTKYKPVSLPKKVYLIDEVHNLSSSAFDALLKTIEEPPSYCVFILCTTELQKIPATILSRCERYTFTKIMPETIKERLKFVLNDLKADCEEGALNLIVRRADGALRDALSILEQLLACADGKITTENAKKSLGIMGEELVIQILGHIMGHRTLEALNMYDELIKNGKAPGLLADNFLETLTDLVTLMSTQSPESIYHSEEYVSLLTDLMEQTNLERLFWLTDQFCELRAAVRGSVTPSMDIRLCIIRTSNKELIKSDPASMASELAELHYELAQMREKVDQLSTRTYIKEVEDNWRPAVDIKPLSGELLDESDGTMPSPAADVSRALTVVAPHPVIPVVLLAPKETTNAESNAGGEKKSEVKEEQMREKLFKQGGGMRSGEKQRDARSGKEGKKGFNLSVKDVFKMLS